MEHVWRRVVKTNSRIWSSVSPSSLACRMNSKRWRSASMYKR